MSNLVIVHIYIHGNGNLDIIIIGLKKLSNYVIVHIYIYMKMII